MAGSKGQKIPAQENIYTALTIAQLQRSVEESKKQFESVAQEHESLKKKKELDDKLHEETRKELHKMKLQYDGNYAFEKKQLSKETMQRARLAKTKTKATVRQKGQEARKKKP